VQKRIIHLNLATASGRLRLSPSSVSQIGSHSPFGACAKSAEVLKVLPWNFSSKIDPKVLNRFWQSKVLILLNLCDICHDSCDFRMLGITESEEVPWQEMAEISLSSFLRPGKFGPAMEREVRWMLENSYQHGLRLGSCSVSEHQNTSIYIKHIHAYCGML